MFAHLFVGLCLAVSDHFAEIFSLRLFETEQFNEWFNTFRRHMTLTLQDFHQETCVHVHSRRKDPIAEGRIERLFEFVKVLQEFTVVGVIVYVDFVSCEHG